MSVLGTASRAQAAGQQLQPQNVMKIGTANAITPWNPGDSREIRTEAIVANHRTFTKVEADSLEIKAAQRKREAENNRRAYRALKKVEAADTSDQVAYRGYQSAVATNIAQKKAADVAKAKTMYGLTDRYAKLGYGTAAAYEKTVHRVHEYQETYAEVKTRWR